MRITRVALIVSVALVCTSCAESAPAPTVESPWIRNVPWLVDLPGQVRKADLVCKGRLEEIRTLKTEKRPAGREGSPLVDHYTRSAVFNVDRAFKGQVKKNRIAVNYVESSHSVNPNVMPLGLKEGMYRLLLLKQSGDSYTFVEEYLREGSLVPITSSQVIAVPGASAEDMLVREYTVTLKDTDAVLAGTAVAVLGLLGSQEAVAALQKVANSSNVDEALRGLALASLIRAGSYACLGKAISFVEAHRTDSEVAIVNLYICDAITWVGQRPQGTKETAVREALPVLEKYRTFRHKRLRSDAQRASERLRRTEPWE